VKVGLLGVGHIADQYVAGMAMFDDLELVAVADRDLDVCRHRARQWGVRGLDPDALLADGEVEIVVNLTPPRAHVATTEAALRAGKHVYSENPLATTVADGRRLIDVARREDLQLACAPDTLLGSAFVTAAEAVTAGMIGRPLSAQAFVGNAGPAVWHPAPETYYESGAGPLFSLGPYYLSALVHILGPIAQVEGFSAQPRSLLAGADGRTLHVTANTTYTGALRFANGPIATLFASYDVHATRVPHLEIHGENATLNLVDPDVFDGTPLIGDEHGWHELPLRGREGYGRGVGVADLADAIENGRAPRADSGLALHVLDAMSALEEGGRHLADDLWPATS
jgi:predicted dehydrogenase